ncbi:MAG: uridine phosphorylase [Candidatus Delongbacteria bacterium]|nr:uridine phosphorylase [Candidatus Delongbacteria bacterium]MBN2833981.1 uridine phosphorylase [Candidatus Delongbacteria bacterium]
MKYHVKLDNKMIAGAKTAILPGDPGRVEKTAKSIDQQAKFLASNREYTSWLANSGNEMILVCSTGIGGPSLGICVEELASLGIKNFLRIGTTGAIQENISVPSLIVSTASVRLDGTSFHYAPLNFPAVSDFHLTKKLVESIEKLGYEHHIGITASSDTFYPGQERYDTFTGYVRKEFQGSLKEWQKLNVLNFEMESSALFTIASVFGLKAACVASVIVNRTKNETPSDSVLNNAERMLADVVKEFCMSL